MKQTPRNAKEASSVFLLPRLRLLLLLCIGICSFCTTNAQKKNGVIRKSVSTTISPNNSLRLNSCTLKAQESRCESTTQRSYRKTPIKRAIHTGIPTGYQQLGSTDLYYTIKTGGIDAGSVTIGSIDLIGKYGEKYYSSTYSDNGYVVAMKVGDNKAVFADCLNGTMVDSVYFSASIEPQGEMARIVYTFINTDSIDKTISVGAYDDAYVGSVINASITKKNSNGDTYGISLSDRAGAELCVIFGYGLAGVTGVDDFWFGSFSTNTSAENMSGNYEGENDGNYMIEEGSYDCGIGWCWKNRVIKAGGSLILSYLIAIGDVNLEPSSTFEVTPDDPDGWNDLSRPHRLTLEGEYESPAGLDGMIEYAVENSEEWVALTDTLTSGDTFTASLVANFDATLPTHTIRFRTVDNVGNATLLPSIVYTDVSFVSLSGIEDKTYTGDSLYQTSLQCTDLADSCYVATNYQNNTNAGTASFSLEGVFPYTIGRKYYTFTINPAQLEGGITTDGYSYEYNGMPIYPGWYFMNAEYAGLVSLIDYDVTYENNVFPGTGTIEVKGIGNYTGSLTTSFFIDKAQLTDSQYTLTLPDEDISYDEQSHEATITCAEGVGVATVSYTKQGEDSTLVTAPIEEGSYDVYLEIADGDFYYGRDKTYVGTFTIYNFDDAEWAALVSAYSTLNDSCGWKPTWDLSQGAKAVSTFEGLEIEKGHIVGLNLSNKGLTSIPQDIAGFSQLKSLNLSHNNLKGNAGSIAALFSSLTTLDLSYNNISDLYPMISTNVTSLDISHQTIDKIVDFDIANLNISQLATQTPTIVLYDHENQKYNTDWNFISTTSENEYFDYSDNEQWAIQLLYKDGLLAMPYISQQNAYHGENGDTLKVFALDLDNNLTGSSFLIRLSFERGDANFNGDVDILDVQTIINYMFNEYQNRPFNFTAADLWKDNAINVQDAICSVNLLLDNASESASSKVKRHATIANKSDGDETDASLTVDDGKLILNSAIPVAAFDITLHSVSQVDLSEDLQALGITVTQKKCGNDIRLIGYSLSGSTIPAGEYELATAEDFNGYITAMLSDQNANEIKLSPSQTTAISTIALDDLSGYDIFNIAGQKLNPSNVVIGCTYIVRSNGHAYKVIITK